MRTEIPSDLRIGGTDLEYIRLNDPTGLPNRVCKVNHINWIHEMLPSLIPKTHPYQELVDKHNLNKVYCLGCRMDWSDEAVYLTGTRTIALLRKSGVISFINPITYPPGEFEILWNAFCPECVCKRGGAPSYN